MALEMKRITARVQLAVALPALVLCLAALGCTSADERRRRVVEAADELLARGDRAAAVATLESFLRYDPRDLAVTVRLARLDLADGRARSALRRLESLPPGAPRGEEYFDELTRARVHAGDVERALHMLLARPRLAEADPQLVEVLVERSAAVAHVPLPDLPASWRARRVEKLTHAGRLAAALDQWRLLPPEADAAVERTRLLELILQAALARDELQFLRQADEVHQPPPTPWKLLARHRLHLDRGEEGEAAGVERLFLRRYRRHPRRFDMLMSRLRRENRSGRAEEALRLAAEASALRPSEVAPILEKAVAYRSLGRADDARTQLELVLAQDPSNEAARLLLRRDDEARRRSDGPQLGKLELKLEAGGT